MDRRSYTNPFVQEQDDPSENALYSPSSGDESKVTTTSSGPSPKKRKGVQKRVVTVPIGDSDGGKSRGETYPPSDSWAWRKYGQKPIKGSPYPRGYYRCSSSKGCPARKQVERSRVDPTMLLLTYASEHNHPLPTAKHHHQSPSTTTSSAAASGEDSPAVKPDPEYPAAVKTESEDPAAFTPQPDLDLVGGDDCLVLSPELDWFTTDVALLEIPMCSIEGFGIYCGNDDMMEEDASLFGDLGELPECSIVFRRSTTV